MEPRRLTKARAQGYTAVIADSTFDGEQTDTVHTGTYVVNTSAGDITVLKEQSELGTLAHGEATSARATAEASDAAGWPECSHKARSIKWNSRMPPETC